VIFLDVLVLLIIGGGVFLHHARKSQSIEKDIRGWITSQSTSDHQRDIQRVSTDVKKLEEEWDTDMTDIECEKLYEEKGKPECKQESVECSEKLLWSPSRRLTLTLSCT
jgi:hypothetical protein